MAFPATIVILPVGIIFILSGLIINVIQVNLIQFNPQYYVHYYSCLAGKFIIILISYFICVHIDQLMLSPAMQQRIAKQ